MAVAVKEAILLIWKSQTYFGQLHVCFWFLSYIATLIGMEVLHSRENNLICNYTADQPNSSVMCPEYDSPRLKRRSSFTVIYGALTFAIWFLYTAHTVPRLRKFRTRKITKLRCRMYVAYLVQLFSKLLVHAVMLFIYILYVHFTFPERLHCALQNATDHDVKLKGHITCTDRYQVGKSVMQTTLLLVLAMLTLFCLVESVYILCLMRSRSRTVFVGDEVYRREHLDNGGSCSSLMPDKQFILFHLRLNRIDPPCKPENESENALLKYFEITRNFHLEKTEYMDNFYLGDTEALKLDDIFLKPLTTEVKRPKSNTRNSSVPKMSEISFLLLTGRAGMGKTTFVQKVVRQWAKGESRLSNRIKTVLYLDLNVLEDVRRTVCLKEVIRNHVPLEAPEEFIDFVKSNPNSIMIVVENVSDSIIEFDDTNFDNTLEERMPFPALLKKLITGKLLKGATILALSSVANSSHSNVFNVESQTEILGFSPGLVKEYTKRYFGSTGQDEPEAIALAESLTDDALSICCVPSNCFYLCSILKWLRSSPNASGLKKKSIIPETITELYLTMVQMIYPMEKRSLCTPTSSNELRPLRENPLDREGSSTDKTSTNSQSPLIHSGACSLAMRSICEERATFTGDEIREELSEEEIPIYFRLIKPPYKDSQETHFSFRWSCLKEFLAAYFIISDISLTKFESLVGHVKEDVSRKRDQVLQFACRLLFQQSHASDKKKKEMIHLVMELGNASQTCKRSQKELQLVMMRCVAEVKDDKLSREVASKFLPFVEFSSCEIGVTECSALANILGASPFASIKRIALADNKISVMGIRQLTQKLLLPCKGPTEELNLKGNALSDLGLEELAEALKKKECKLKILNLADNDITSAGVAKLSLALVSNTSLEELNLSCNEICSQGVSQLATVLRKETTKISRLNLSWNKIGDDGAASLTSVRQSTLNVAWNNIGIKGVRSLASSFQTFTNLEDLDLSGNIIGGVGLEALLPCLIVPVCKIKCLGLNYCDLADQGAIHCIDILTFPLNQITSLGLAGNSITNDGVRKIAQALGSLECKVKSLNLSSNLISDDGVESLSITLASATCNLQELDLSGNKIQDKGCKCLAAAIRKRNCLLRLNLQRNQVGDEGATQLLSAIRIHNCKLQSLILNENDITDEGISGLPHAFGSPHCKLENLKLRKNFISRNSLETLSEAKKSPFCRLEQLVFSDSM